MEIPARFQEVMDRAAARRANECKASIHCWNQRDGDDPFCPACRRVKRQTTLFPEG